VSQRDVQVALESQLGVIDDPSLVQAKKDSTLYGIVLQRLVDQAAQDAGVNVSRDEVNRFRQRKVRELERNGAKLEAHLAERGMSPLEFDELIRKQIRGQRWMRMAMGGGFTPGLRVRPRTEIYVSPADIRAFYDADPARFHVASTARVRRVAIQTDLAAEDRAAATAAARAKAEAIQRRLRSGEDWVPVFREAVAAEPKDGMNFDWIATDGLIEIVERPSVHAPFIEQFACTQPKGEVSDVIQKGLTFYVLRAEGVQPERQVPFEEAQPKIEAALADARRQVAFYDVELGLLEAATVQPAELAAKLRDHLSGARRALVDQIAQ
jgi:parvulin-like peptidyl-prolyl isomerase